jgi:hypothetical protein
MPVVALTGNQAFVLLTPWTQNEVRQVDLDRMTVRVRTEVQNPNPFSEAFFTMSASTDGRTVLLGAASPSYSAPFYLWRYDAASDAFSPPMSFSYSMGNQVAVNDDGTVLGFGTFTLDRNLLPLVPIPITGLSTLLPGAGALRYSAGDEVQISDTRSGRVLLSVAAPGRANFGAFAVDPSGQKILACTASSLNYYQLAVVPLAVATVTPETAAPGASLTVRGSGFVAGTTATIAGTSASCAMLDAQTLQCSVPAVKTGLAPMTLSNPDGQTYSLEAALRVK